MVPWSSPRSHPYRDTSPISPVSPLSPGSLPQWLRSGPPKPGLFLGGRVKTYGVILAMALLGFWATAALGPGEDSIDIDVAAYDASSGGVLADPSGFGKGQGDVKAEYGIIGEDSPEELAAGEDDSSRKPSVKGALSELHHAVKDKLQSWNPYSAQPGRPPLDVAANSTTAAKGKKKPVGASSPKFEDELIVEGNAEKEGLGARTRIGKCSIVFNSNGYWERALKTHEVHDKIHGYRLHVLRQEMLDTVWSKPGYILSLLLRELAKPESERLEWLLWVDADTIILNPYVPIEAFLPPPGPEFEDVHLIFSNDWNGLNNGVFPIRVNRWAVDLFSAVLSYRYYRPDADLTFRDQSAMNALMHEPRFVNSIVEAPQRWFNAYQGEHNETLAPFQIRRGDLLVHFAGVPDREKRMGYWLERAEAHLDDWEVPYKSTSYITEARDFWEKQRGIRKDRAVRLAETRTKATALLTKTDEWRNAHDDRLTDDENALIAKAHDELLKVVNDDKWQDKLATLEELISGLEHATEPLKSAAEQSHKLLLASAHEAIFAGEKDLMQAGLTEGMSDPDLRAISESVKSLKNLVMSPQEFWSNQDLSQAVNAVTHARGRVLEKTAQQQAALEAQGQAEQERQKAIEAARKQVQAEAGIVAAPPAMDAVIQTMVVSMPGPQVTVQSIALQVVTAACGHHDPRGCRGLDHSHSHRRPDVRWCSTWNRRRVLKTHVRSTAIDYAM